MNDELRQMVIETLRRGEELPAEWAPLLFPPEKRECELTYVGKEREEEIIASTLAVPLQPVRTFGKVDTDFGWRNMLVFGDNLQAMKTLLEMKQAGKLINADGTPGVRLVYIDPPFASSQEFHGSEEQKAYHDKILGARFVEFLRTRLVLIHELLSHDGALYLHLDWKKVHYIKVVMDEVFGENNFRNEIIWHYPGREMHIPSKFNAKHDTLLFYARSTVTQIRMDQVSIPYDRLERLKGLRRRVHLDETGREWVWETRGQAAGQAPYKRFVDEIIAKGRPLSDVWSDVQFLRGNHPERTGYPTQKPSDLIERVIKASSREGDIVLDAFAGSGTTCAVAEKLGRRWIAIDSGKLAIYTIQRRMLSLKEGIGQKGKPLTPKPFTLYNAGLYDFSTLRQLPWQDWCFFALQLFGCRDEPHTIGGLKLDGKRQGASVLVFDHLAQPGRRIDEETIESIHAAVGDKVGSRFFIIAPRGVFDFQQDYIDLGDVRYYALRIPYSFINELHHREFTALKQPSDETDVNAIVDAVGFDFIRPPQVTWTAGLATPAAMANTEPAPQAYLQVQAFESRAYIRGQDTRGGLETFSLALVDLDYDGDLFVADQVHFAAELKANDWRIWIERERVGAQNMVVFIDIFGNEAREIVRSEHFGLATPAPVAAAEGV